MKNRTGKTIITLLAVIALLMGIMPFAGKRVDAAVTEVVFDSSTWEDEFFGHESSFTDKDNLVTATVTGDVSFYEQDSCAEFNFSGPSSLSFEASEGNQFTSITVYLADSLMSCPANWEKGDSFTWKWTKGGNKATIDVEERTLFRIRSITFVLEPADEPVLTEYPLWVGGKQVTSEYLSNETEGWSYDPETKTLTLENANITGISDATWKSCIYADQMRDTLTILLKGDNNIGSKDARRGIDTLLTPIVITGDGSLTISDVTSAGIQDEGSSITIKDTTVTLKNCNDGIEGTYKVEINNSIVTVTGGKEGISDFGVTIIDSKVDVKVTNIGIITPDKKITISGDSYVSAEVTDSGAKAETYAMISWEDFELDGVEIIEPEEGYTDSYKLDNYYDVHTVVDKYGNVAPKAVIAKTYTVKFVNDDGTVLQEKKTPVYETPKYEGNTPTKESDDKYKYTFKGWDKEISEVKGDATYTAVYDKTPIETPEPEPEPKPVMPFSIPKTGVE